MIISYKGERRETGTADATGYKCDSVEMKARDFRYLRDLYERDYAGFTAWLTQMTARFPENRK